MFKAPFSFEGRIRRKEYGITILIYVFFAFLINMLAALMQSGDASSNIALGGTVGIATLLLYFPVLWLVYAQGAKRCHDLGKSGWWQLIPFYVFVMLFQDGVMGMNEYGVNPKEDNTGNIIESIGQKEI
jgi:uncharacterized membrane protein YhaH (DUF805 family)